jgi:hypothetical protein
MGGRAGSVGMRVSGKRSSAYRPRSIRVQAATPGAGARDGDDVPTPVASTHAGAGAGAPELRAKPSDASLAPTAVGADDEKKDGAPKTAIFIPLFKGAAEMEKRRQQRMAARARTAAPAPAAGGLEDSSSDEEIARAAPDEAELETSEDSEDYGQVLDADDDMDSDLDEFDP